MAGRKAILGLVVAVLVLFTVSAKGVANKQRSKSIIKSNSRVDVQSLYEEVKRHKTKGSTSLEEHSGKTLKKANKSYVPNEIIIKFSEKVADATAVGLSRKTNVKDLKLTSSLDKLNKEFSVQDVKPIVRNFKEKRQNIQKLLNKNKKSLTANEQQLLRRLSRAPHGAKVPDLDRIYKLTVDLKLGQSLRDAIAAYNSDPDVEYAHVNHIMKAIATPNDALYSLQWALNNTGQSYPPSEQSGTSGSDIDAPEAWDIHTGSDNVVVAVIDTGVDYNHRDLADNMWADANGYHGYDFVNNDNYPMDDGAHGTHVAGIIAAKGNNSYDTVGACWTAKIMAVKFLDNEGGGTGDDAIAGIEYAVDNGADILSNSWGGGGYDQAMQDAIDYAYSQGAIVVASAGNDGSTVPGYPASQEHVFSVAATDSDDNLASFSTYGNWVDIAAPGVDILSLRASGTSMGDVYDDYTTVASGTSMACPYVSGACALLLSYNPTLGNEEVYNVLMDTVDEIFDPNDHLVISNGRLNISSAVSEVHPSKGHIFLDAEYYNCSDVITIRLGDVDLEGVGTYDVNVTTSVGDIETITLTETTPAIGVFTGTISIESGDPNTQDGMLQISHGQIITVTYYDANDGTGNPATVIVMAEADCMAPVISNLDIDASVSIPEITFDTNEPAITKLLLDVNCGQPYEIQLEEGAFSTSHIFRVKGLEPNTQYYFAIEAEDIVGNTVQDNNTGQCYTFTTSTGLGDINVPGDFNTIQAAINHAWDGDAIWLADGNYSGAGNYNIDYDGRSITVKSVNGPNNCIIDCNGLGRGFIFRNGEDSNSVVDGLTITRGYSDTSVSYVMFEGGSGIYSWKSSPRIVNCKIIENASADYGGAIYCDGGDITVENCILDRNSAWGGSGFSSDGTERRGRMTFTNCTISNGSSCGMDCYDTDLILKNCDISNNKGTVHAGGMYFSNSCTVDISDCVIRGNAGPLSDNREYGSGGGMYFTIDSSGTVSNCKIKENSAYYGGGIYGVANNVTFKNCLIEDNTASYGGGVLQDSWGSSEFVNCTISGNTANSEGGGIAGIADANIILTNCILWSNTAEAEIGKQISLFDEWNQPGAQATVSYCDIEGGQSEIYTGETCTLNWGSGNIDSDPVFAFEKDRHILGSSSCKDAGTNNPQGGLSDEDFDGNPRILNSITDMGVYESNGVAPSIAISSDLFQFVCEQGGANPSNQTLSLRNCGGSTLSWQVNENCSWLSVAPASGTSTGEIDNVTISVNNNGLQGGIVYESNITVSDDNAVNNPRTILVKFHVIGVFHVPSEYSTIQAAINASHDGDIVEVADGIYRGEGNRDIGFGGRAITVRSANGPSNCIIDCNGTESDPHRGFNFESTGEGADSVIDGLTIRNGYVTLFLEFEPVLRSCLPYGGAIYCLESSPTIQNCIIENNVAIDSGGGIYTYGENLDRTLISNCIIRNNNCPAFWGGGGGGIFGLDFIVENSIISDNTSDDVGGGIVCYYMSADINNCTIVNNSAATSGGGIFRVGGYRNGVGNVSNSVVWGNTASNGPQIALWRGYYESDPNSDFTASVLTISYSDIAGGQSNIYVEPNCVLDWANGNIDEDPLFVSAGSDNFHLSQGSPCINIGDPSGNYSSQKDIDGQARVQSGRVDMGADETSGVYIPGQGQWYETLQDAIDDADSNDVIEVYPGTYDETLYWYSKNITLQGIDLNDWDVIEATVIDGNSSKPTIEVHNFTVTIRGLSITGGGGIYDGVYCGDGGVVLNNSNIYGNANGVSLQGSDGTIENCKIHNNTYDGITTYDWGDLIVKNNWIYDNGGSGVFLEDEECDSSSPQIINNTFVGNSYGTYDYHSCSHSVTNCILWDNNDDLADISATYSCIQDGDSGTGNISSDPCFVNTTADNFHLDVNSPCINMGDPNYVPDANETDIDGDVRKYGAYVDIGADEVLLTQKAFNVNKKEFYSVLQDAIDDTNEGDVIEVYPGTYYEWVYFDGAPCTLTSIEPNNWDIVAETIIDANYAYAQTVAFDSNQDSGSVLRGFNIKNSTYCGIYCYINSSPLIEKCMISNCDTYGIWCVTDSAPTIQNNKIFDNGVAGIRGWKTREAVIRNNLIHNNGERGISFDSAYSAAAVTNNTIVNHTKYGVSKGIICAAPVISNCVIWDCNDDLKWTSATYSCIQDGDSGTGNISSNPLFVDADANDFHLDVNSPCINMGDPNYVPDANETDIDGDVRKYGAYVDIGADEVLLTQKVFNVSKQEFYSSIEAAVDDADSNDVIEVYPGTYDETLYWFSKSITLQGIDINDWDVIGTTVVDGNSSRSTFEAYGSTFTVKGLSITGGGAYRDGVSCREGGSVTLNHCNIYGNVNGVSVDSSDGTIENCKIHNNTSCGITTYDWVDLIVKNNWIYDNGTSGVFLEDEECDSPSPQIINNTFVGNSYGVYDYHSCSHSVANCILWDNTDDLADISATYSCIQDGDSGTGNISSNPLFVDADANNFHLDVNSPGIDAGDPNGTYTGQLDIDSEQRVIGDEVDMGADEYSDD